MKEIKPDMRCLLMGGPYETQEVVTKHFLPAGAVVYAWINGDKTPCLTKSAAWALDRKVVSWASTGQRVETEFAAAKNLYPLDSDTEERTEEREEVVA